MADPPNSGYFACGLPFNRIGSGAHPLLVIQGLQFENRPMRGLELRYTAAMYRFLSASHTVYLVGRRPGLPQGTTLADMAADYGTMVRDEFGEPVDVIGISTGGSIALYLAAEHEEAVRRLVIHSAAHSLTPEARRAQLDLASCAARGDWRAGFFGLLAFMRGGGPTARAVASIGALMMSLDHPLDAHDLVVTIVAEDVLDFRDRLHAIGVPVLVAAGTLDPFYSEALFRETAAGIPNARLKLYPGMGHPAYGRQFEQDVLAFLRGEPGPAVPRSTSKSAE
jgi:pimeloyl-ACP methyl ester carboxylesterase